MILDKFDYQPCPRIESPSRRLYSTPDGHNLASVTTILSKTKSKEDQESLQRWKDRVGAEEAQKITTSASSRGTEMHQYLEDYITSDVLQEALDNPQSIKSRKMARVIINHGLKNVDEYWGVECPLYYPELYAGTTDVVGVWKGKPAIMDFKQSNKPKKSAWITDYKLQLCAYAQAHNYLYKTDITTGVVFVCTVDYQYQEFVIEGDEFEYYSREWCNRIMQFYGLPKLIN